MGANGSMGRITRLTGLDADQVRFYAQVFADLLRPSPGAESGEALMRRRLEVLRRARELVLERGLTIDAARDEMRAAFGLTDHAPLRTARPASAQILDRPKGRVIAVSSGKGGVGKTTFTVNLALTMAQMGQRVAIFDADLGMANVHILLGVKPELNLRHVCEEQYSLDDVVTEGPLGVRLICAGQGVRAMANMGDDERRAILRQLDGIEREVDILLLDTGAGISENALKFCAFADEIVIMTTPDLTAAADAYSIVKVLLEMDPRAKIGVVANQIDNPYQSKNVFNRLNSAVRKYLNTSLGDLGYIVDDPHVKNANRMRKPFRLEHPECEASRCLDAIATTMLHTGVFRNRRKPPGVNGLMGELKRDVARA